MINLNRRHAPPNDGCREIEPIVIIQDGNPSVTTYVVKLTRIVPFSELLYLPPIANSTPAEWVASILWRDV